ncbi:MAG: substrate-binding domain-containing protein [Gemmatimonadaceae bacterium]
MSGSSVRSAGRLAGALQLATAAALAAAFAAAALPGALTAQQRPAPGQPAPGQPAPAPAAADTAPVADGMAELRVCADPDNMPFSNERQEGFENRIAQLIARDLGVPLKYQWWPQRRGFVRNTIRARQCDLLVGAPRGFDPVATTRPYYRSTYYIVSRADRAPRIRSLDDPALRRLRVGVHIIGNDYENPPPAHALGKRGIIAEGFNTFYGPGADNEPQDIIDALVARKIDVAVVWGPIAGYFAKHAAVPLTLDPLPDSDTVASGGRLPFAFDIAMGMRRSDKSFRAQVERVLDRRQPEIQRILQEYGVPTLPLAATASSGAKP